METRTEAMPASSATATPLRSLVIAIAGSGGDGVALIGDLLLKMAAHQGLYGILVQSYGPQIRGGESAVVLRIGDREICYEGEDTDVLVCFRASDLKRFKGSLHLHDDSQLILEEKDPGALPDWLGTTKKPAFRHPFATWDGDVEVAGEPKNMMALALVCRALGWPESLAQQALAERFSHKPALVERNMPTFRKAYEAPNVPQLLQLKGHGVPLVVETGNEAVARGAMSAGLEFFAGYPITPSSEVMETLIDELPAVGGRIIQAEDEISALGMVAGVSNAATFTVI